MKINYHFSNLLVCRYIWVECHFLCHFCNNDISYVIILESVILMTSLTMFSVTYTAINYAIFVTLIVKFQRFFPKSLFSKYQSILITIRIKMNNPQSTIYLNDLTPVWRASRFVKFHSFELKREAILLN